MSSQGVSLPAANKDIQITSDQLQGNCAEIGDIYQIYSGDAKVDLWQVTYKSPICPLQVVYINRELRGLFKSTYRERSSAGSVPLPRVSGVSTEHKGRYASRMPFQRVRHPHDNRHTKDTGHPAQRKQEKDRAENLIYQLADNHIRCPQLLIDKL